MESTAPTTPPDLLEAHTSQRRRPDEPRTIGVFVIEGEYCDLELTVVNNGNVYYPLTDCCGASATGSMGATCCRACYEEVDTILGACWTETEWQQRNYQKVSDQ